MDAFLERLIGIAKRAKVRPNLPSRALLSPIDGDPIDAGPVPPFYDFVTAALDIAMDVIRSSPLPPDRMDAALAALANVTDQSLVKALERLRGKVSDYRESVAGLVESGPAEDADQAGPQDGEANSA